MRLERQRSKRQRHWDWREIRDIGTLETGQRNNDAGEGGVERLRRETRQEKQTPCDIIRDGDTNWHILKADTRERHRDINYTE